MSADNTQNNKQEVTVVTTPKKEFSSMSINELIAIFSNPNNPDYTFDEINQAKEAFDEKFKELTATQPLIEFFKNNPPSKINITKVAKVANKPKGETEELIYKLMVEKKITEDKALYALSINRVISIFLTLKEEHQKTHKALEEMSQKLDTFMNQSNENKDSEEKTALQKELEAKQEELKTKEEEINNFKKAHEKEIQELKMLIEEKNEQKIEANTEETTNTEDQNEELQYLKEENEAIINILSVKLKTEPDNITLDSIDDLFENFKKNIEDKIKEENSSNSIAPQELTLKDNEIEEMRLKIEALNESIKFKDEKLKENQVQIETLEKKLQYKESGVKEPEEEESYNKEEALVEEEQDEIKKFNFKAIFRSKALKTLMFLSVISGAGYYGYTQLDDKAVKGINSFIDSKTQPKTEALALDVPKEATQGAKNAETQKITESSLSVFNEATVDEPILDGEALTEDKQIEQTEEIAQEVPKLEIKKEEVELSSTDFLKSLKAQLKITPDRKVEYKNRLYAKNEKLENYTIAFVSNDFILFMDYKNNNEIIKLFL